MEPHPGVFVSTNSPALWKPDPDVPGSEMHELMKVEGTWAGFTRFTTVDGPQAWTPPQRETIHIIEGAVQIEIAGGPTITLNPGDVASLPAGIPTTWHITVPFKEFWLFS